MSLTRLLLQPPAQSKVSYDFRSGCSVLWIQMDLENPQLGRLLGFLGNLLYSSALLPYIQSKCFFFLFTSIVFCSSSIHCYKEPGFILLITSPQILEACCQVCPMSSLFQVYQVPATSESAYGICASLWLFFFMMTKFILLVFNIF